MHLRPTLGRLGAAIAARPRRLGRSFAASRHGGIAVIAAMAVPAVALGAVGAIQLHYVYSVRSLTQDAADNAAELGAGQLVMAPVGATSRAQQWALSQLSSLTGRATVNVTATVIDSQTLKVAIDTNVPSFFGNMLPAGGFDIHSEATAVGAALTPLCVLVTAPTSTGNLHLTGLSQMQSTCMVLSNSTVTVDPQATLSAGAIQSGGAATGTMSPAAQTGAPARPDPFASLNTTAPASCTGPKPAPTTIAGSQTLAPGAYCGDITLKGNVTLTLSGGAYVFGGNLNVGGASTLALNSGDFYISGNLIVSGNGSVTGTDADLDFFQASLGPIPTMNLSGSATMSISGRQGGPLAGFVIIVDKSYTGNFQIQSDYISKLTGAVYSPAATLQIQGTGKGIQASDWTVIAASSLQLTGSPDVIINSNYSGSSVPVPIGVGNNSSSTRLTR